jgi:serine/threonine protein kinase
MWSLGIITLCLLTGDPFISFEELQDLNQTDIAVKLAQTGRNYPQWRHLNLQGKDFIKRLLVLEPLRRMTAKEAVDHEWFRKPTRIAVELDKLYERSIVFWSKRLSHIGIVEDLPDVLPDVSGRKNFLSNKANNVHRKVAQKRIPEAASPYFGLDRHLHPRGARTKSSLHSQRKRILAELKEADSQFIDSTTRPEEGMAVKLGRFKSSSHLQREDLATDMSSSSTPILRPKEPSSTSGAVRTTLASRPGRPATGEPRGGTNTISGANMSGPQRAVVEAPESEGDTNNAISANKPRRRTSSPKTGLGIRQVDGNDLFGTIPIEIKAAEAAEAEHAAYDDLFQSFLDREDEEMYDDFAEIPVKPLTSGYTLSQDDREMYDEAAKDLPKLSTAKAFSEAIAKRKMLKGSGGQYEQ